MKRHRPHILFLLLVIFLGSICTRIAAQTRTVTISGVLTDKENGESIELGTIQLFSLPDSAIITGCTSHKDGSFSLHTTSRRECLVRCSFVGYIPKDIKVSLAGKKTVSLGKIAMNPDAFLLKETIVTAEAIPVQMVEDTVVYSAAAYKTTEGAVLEELIEKLPGAEIADDGSIRINGKELKKIMVNGREFFGGDLKTGLQNLPVELIEQLKTYDKESDMKRMTGIDDGEEETVLDIKIKKDKNNGWFGNANLAGGSHQRYTGKMMANRFNETDQLSFLASANNVNDQTFSAGLKSHWQQNRGDIAAQEVGVNLSIQKTDYSLDGNAQFTGSNTDAQGRQSAERFYSSKSSFSNANTFNRDFSRNFHSDLRFEWKITPRSSILFRPSFTYVNGDNKQRGISRSFNANPLEYEQEPNDFLEFDSLVIDPFETIRVNSSHYRNAGNSERINGGMNLIFNQLLSDNGRRISFRIGGNLSNSENERYRNSQTRYHLKKNHAGTDSIMKRIQYLPTENHSKSLNAQITYSESLFKSVLLQFSYLFTYRNNNSDRQTYDFNKFEDWTLGDSFPTDMPSLLLDSLGKKATYHYYNHDISTTLRIVKPKFRLSAGISLQPQRSVLLYEKGENEIDTVQHFFNYAPKIDFRYKFSKHSVLQFTYHGRSRQPNMELMLPITDYSQPLNIRVGNPGLSPSFAHNLRLNMNFYQPKYQRSFMLNGQLSFIQNNISNVTSYNEETGGRITTAKNINGNWGGNLATSFNTALKNKRFSIHANANFRYRNNVNYLYDAASKATYKNTITDSRISNRLRGSYRNDWLEIILNGDMSYHFERDKFRPENNQEPYSFAVGSSVSFRLPSRTSFSSSLVRQSRRGYADSNLNRDEWIWNAQISQTFWKGSCTLSLEAFDILREHSNLIRSISSAARTITAYNGVNNYLMAHFIYRINVMGGHRVNGNTLKKKMKSRR